MPLPGTTGTSKTTQKQAIDAAVWEVTQPSAAVSTAAAATLNQGGGQITTEALATAAGQIYSLTLTNSLIAANTMVFATAQNGTSTTGHPGVSDVKVTAGQAVISVSNDDPAAALNGTIIISFFLVRKGPTPL